MKKIAAIVCVSAIIVWSVAGCGGCPPACGVAPSTGCTIEVVTYSYTTDNVVRSTTVGGDGCFTPSKDSSGNCPGQAFIQILGEQGFPANLPGCPPGLPVVWPATSSSLSHLTGQAESDGWSGILGTNAPGWLQYGPYTTDVALGQNVAFWSLQIEGSLPASSSTILTLDVNDATTQTEVASTQVGSSEWSYPNVYQFFALPFAVKSTQLGHQFEFRVYWSGGASVKEQGCGVMQLQYQGTDPRMSHDAGNPYIDALTNQADAWGSDVGQAGWFMYGPNSTVTPLNSGPNVGLFTLYSDAGPLDCCNYTGVDPGAGPCCPDVCYLDVFDYTTQTIVASTTLTSDQFTGWYQTFALPFTVDSSNSGHQFTLRVYSYGFFHATGPAVFAVNAVGFASSNP